MKVHTICATTKDPTPEEKKRVIKKLLRGKATTDTLKQVTQRIKKESIE